MVETANMMLTHIKVDLLPILLAILVAQMVPSEPNAGKSVVGIAKLNTASFTASVLMIRYKSTSGLSTPI